MLFAARHAIRAGFRLPRSSLDIEGGDTMRSKLLIGTLALGAAALVSGCVAHAYGEADAPVAFSAEPTLVVVEPDVWVVRDYDYAVYYVDGYYWVYRGDVWYRSPTYERGWTTVEVNVVPRVIVSRDHHAYVHYHGAADAQTRKAPRERAAVAPAGDKDKGARSPDRADDRHDGPPGQDKGARSPERADDRHDGPPGQDKGARPPDRADDRRVAPPGPADKQAPGKKDNKKKGDKK
jgi:hypothetical protein